MQREEKQLEATLQAILNRVNDLKAAIQGLITKLETEYETIHWPSFLDNYAILSGHVSITEYWEYCMNIGQGVRVVSTGSEQK